MESLDKDSKIFKNKSLSDVMSTIYDNSTKKQKIIESLLESVKSTLSNITDISVILPIIKDVLDVSVKNDEQMIKLAAIIQRLIQPSKITGGINSDPFEILSESEKTAILNRAKELGSIGSNQEIDAKLNKLQADINKSKEIVETQNKMLIDNIEHNPNGIIS